MEGGCLICSPEPTERGGGLDPSDSPDGVSTGGRR